MERVSVSGLISTLTEGLGNARTSQVVKRGKQVGFLKIVLSMMYGGKSSFLIHIIETLGYACKILYINHVLDNRDVEPYSTHSISLSKSLSTKLNSTMIKVTRLADISEDVLKAHPVVCIDEGQFFEDLDTQVRYMVDVLGLKVYVASLNGDYKRRKFGQIIDLIPDMDDIVVLKDTLCSKCALEGEMTPALFTWRIKDDSQTQIEVGAANYMPVCRGCFNSLEKERMISYIPKLRNLLEGASQSAVMTPEWNPLIFQRGMAYLNTLETHPDRMTCKLSHTGVEETITMGDVESVCKDLSKIFKAGERV